MHRLPDKDTHVALCVATFHLEFSRYAFVRDGYSPAYFYVICATIDSTNPVRRASAEIHSFMH